MKKFLRNALLAGLITAMPAQGHPLVWAIGSLLTGSFIWNMRTEKELKEKAALKRTLKRQVKTPKPKIITPKKRSFWSFKSSDTAISVDVPTKTPEISTRKGNPYVVLASLVATGAIALGYYLWNNYWHIPTPNNQDSDFVCLAEDNGVSLGVSNKEFNSDPKYADYLKNKQDLPKKINTSMNTDQISTSNPETIKTTNNKVETTSCPENKIMSLSQIMDCSPAEKELLNQLEPTWVKHLTPGLKKQFDALFENKNYDIGDIAIHATLPLVAVCDLVPTAYDLRDKECAIIVHAFVPDRKNSIIAIYRCEECKSIENRNYPCLHTMSNVDFSDDGIITFDYCQAKRSKKLEATIIDYTKKKLSEME